MVVVDSKALVSVTNVMVNVVTNNAGLVRPSRLVGPS